MSATPEGRRTAFIAGMRKVADILEEHPEVPLPEGWWHNPLTWRMLGVGRRQVVALEKALKDAIGAPLAGAIDPEYDNYYVLTGDLDGMPIRILAWVGDVAERKVIGTQVVEQVEWVRLPVPDDEAQAPEGEAQS